MVTKNSSQVLAISGSLWWTPQSLWVGGPLASATNPALEPQESPFSCREFLEESSAVAGAQERPPLEIPLRIHLQVRWDAAVRRWHLRNTCQSTPAIVKAGSVSKWSFSKLASIRTTAGEGWSGRSECQEHFKFGDVLLTQWPWLTSQDPWMETPGWNAFLAQWDKHLGSHLFQGRGHP